MPREPRADPGLRQVPSEPRSRARRGTGVLDLREAGNGRRSLDRGSRDPATTGRKPLPKQPASRPPKLQQQPKGRSPASARDPGRVARSSSASKRWRVVTISKPPWKSARWRKMSRHGRAIAFQEKYCRSPKGHGFGKPLKLGRFQKEFLEEALAEGIEAAINTMGRGNGKSTGGGGLGTWAVFDDDDTGAPQVPIVATTVGQAIKSCYGVAAAMVDMEPELKSRAQVFTGVATPRIYVPFNRGELFPISNDVDGLQGLDPSIAIIDEIGFQPIASYAALKLAGGKRDRSLLLGLGTKGTNADNALEHLRRQVKKLGGLPGLVYREYSTPATYALNDRAGWRLANPALVEGFLRESAIASDLSLPEGLFRIFRLNQTIEGADSWLGTNAAAVWDGLLHHVAPIPGARTWVGIDVALKRDSTAVVFVQRRPDCGKLHAWCRIWTPKPDVPVDVGAVMAYLRRMHQLFDVATMEYDPRFFDVPANMLRIERLPMHEATQSVELMTRAVGATYSAILNAEIHHSDDYEFRSHVLGAKPRYTGNGTGFTLEKLRSRNQIDGAIGLCLATNAAVREVPKRPRKPRYGVGS